LLLSVGRLTSIVTMTSISILHQGWQIDENSAAKISGGIVFFWGPYDSDTGSTVSVLICSEVVSSTLSLREYMLLSKLRLDDTILPGYGIISEKGREINGLPCIELVDTFLQTGAPSTFYVKQKSVTFLENAKVYWLSFMASMKYYDMYLSAFEESIQTFGLGAPKNWFTILGPELNALIVIAVGIPVSTGVILAIKRRDRNVSTQVATVRTQAPTGQTTQTEQIVYCYYCGAPLPTDAAFCRKCGKSQMT